MSHQFLYQSYGSPEIINECKYALLRLFDVYGKDAPRVIIYTDKPEAFSVFAKEIPIMIREIDAALIRKWRGDINFVHRIKIEVIKDCLQQWPGKTIYLDSDTYLLSSLQPVFDKINKDNVFFHENEGTFAAAPNLHFKKWKSFITSQPVPELQTPDPLQTPMWNAGVIGLDAAHLPLLDEVIALTDALYPKFPKHTVEQFSFCYTFYKNHIAINGAKDIIFHYWNLKEFRELLQKFFAKYHDLSLYDWAMRSRNVLPDRMLADKLAYERLNPVSKFIKKITGKAWNIHQYTV